MMDVGDGGQVEVEENLETALVPVDTAANPSWADVAATEKDDTVVDILRIVLKKTEKSGSFFLSDVERSRLVFRQLGIAKSDVVGIDLEDYRTIRVHLTCPAEGYKIAHSIQVKDGLVTLPMRMFRRLTKVFIARVGVGGDTAEVEEMLEHFGTVEERIRWRTYYDNHQNPALLTEDEKLLGEVVRTWPKPATRTAEQLALRTLSLLLLSPRLTAEHACARLRGRGGRS